jgi:mRNA interferase MazF
VPTSPKDAYIPERGDVISLSFDPQAGHEQAGRRPALVLSPKLYNKKLGLALVCPVTRQVKGYPFEVVIPNGLAVGGAILADQVRNLDWRARGASLLAKVPPDVVDDVIERIEALLK